MKLWLILAAIVVCFNQLSSSTFPCQPSIPGDCPSPTQPQPETSNNQCKCEKATFIKMLMKLDPGTSLLSFITFLQTVSFL